MYQRLKDFSTFLKAPIQKDWVQSLNSTSGPVFGGQVSIDRPLHQAALKWVLQDANVAAAVAGMMTVDEIRELTQVIGVKFTSTDD